MEESKPIQQKPQEPIQEFSQPIQQSRVIIPDSELQMVWVQGGTFNMGTNSGESDEKPVHPEAIADFYIGKYEVTQKLWQLVMGTNPSKFKGENLPVERVSWTDLQLFLRKLNQLTGKNYRIPTEAEWEYAARGGQYSKGYKCAGNDKMDKIGWYSKNSDERTHPVGLKLPNELGIYDMSGNVWEWVSDFWRPTYNSQPSGPNHTIRGGSFQGASDHYCRTTHRSSSEDDGKYYLVGFRLALSD